MTNGTAVNSTVVATGTTPFNYQWKNDGGNILDATNSSFSLPIAQTSDAGSYSVAVSNSVGGTNSSDALLTVIVPNRSSFNRCKASAHQRHCHLGFRQRRNVSRSIPRAWQPQIGPTSHRHARHKHKLVSDQQHKR